jgi:2-iminoacetate synthase
LFLDILSSKSWDEISQQIQNATEEDVRRVLSKNTLLHSDDFAVLISPAAQPFLEEMAARSVQLTRKRFGNTIQIYAPLYLSNECQNICTYCGFSLTNKIPRKTLTPEEILEEVKILKSRGIDHVLLVTGEAQKTVGVEYIGRAIDLIQPYFTNISIEVQPLEEDEYKFLIDKGLYSVLVYQETYHKENYKKFHTKGKKSNFEYRLDTPDRLGRAGIHKIGIGALIGLEDWRTDSFFTAMHLEYLEKKYWQTKYSISFPRMRPHEGGEFEVFESSERDLLQLIFAWRIFRENIELSLSTRERAHFRDHVVTLGITTMSAASSTEPGGYAAPDTHLEQFEIDDARSVKEVEEMIRQKGLDPVFKDWMALV